jgi:hypothetical protein
LTPGAGFSYLGHFEPQTTNPIMSATLLAEVEETTDLNLSLEELDAILETDVVNSVPPFVNV